MSERVTNLVAEPGERVEVRCTAKYGWEPAEIASVETRWFLGFPDSNGTSILDHVNWYRVRLDRRTNTKVLHGRDIRKPQAAPEQP